MIFAAQEMAGMLGTGKKANSHTRLWARIYDEAPNAGDPLPSLTESYFTQDQPTGTASSAAAVPPAEMIVGTSMLAGQPGPAAVYM